MRYASDMITLKARVRNGRLVLDEPTSLPEGAEVWLVPADDGEMSDDERAELDDALLEAIADVEAGRTTDADELMAELRAPRVGGGRLVPGESTTLPEGAVVELAPTDGADDLDDAERAALHESLRTSIEQMRAGQLVDGDELLERLRSRR